MGGPGRDEATLGLGGDGVEAGAGIAGTPNRAKECGHRGAGALAAHGGLVGGGVEEPPRLAQLALAGEGPGPGVGDQALQEAGAGRAGVEGGPARRRPRRAAPAAAASTTPHAQRTRECTSFTKKCSAAERYQSRAACMSPVTTVRLPYCQREPAEGADGAGLGGRLPGQVEQGLGLGEPTAVDERLDDADGVDAGLGLEKWCSQISRWAP